MSLFFDCRNIEYRMGNTSQGLIVKCDCINKTGQSFTAVVFKVLLFSRLTPLGSTTAVINGFPAGQTRTLEAAVIDLQDRKIITSITRCDIVAESAY